MVKVAVLDLNGSENWNRWIVGTPPDVPKSSLFYSEQVQMAFVNNPEKEEFLKIQVEHYHTPPIEEFILVLQGTLTVKVEDSIILLKPMQLLAFPPYKRHTIADCTSPLRYLLIRTPISTEKTKVVTK
jgi:mannose-6-phosphate isomerase-like protein (cupin superfamily)